jgi:hypothetical protein
MITGPAERRRAPFACSGVRVGSTFVVTLPIRYVAADRDVTAS